MQQQLVHLTTVRPFMCFVAPTLNRATKPSTGSGSEKKTTHEHIAGQSSTFIFKRALDIIKGLMLADHISPRASNCCVEGGLGMPTVWVFSSAPLCSFISFASCSQTLVRLNQITIKVAG